MEIVIGMADKAQRREAAFRGVDGEFLAKLPDQCRFGCLASLDLAAGEFPQPGHGFVLGALCQKHPPVGIDQHDRADKNRRQARREIISFGSRH